MANDIDKTSPHYKGEFGSIYEVNQKFPNGGVAGDYVEIDGWAHYWNADRGTWCVNAQRDSYWDELITGIINKLKLFNSATYMGVAGVSTVPEKIAGVKMYYFAKAAGTYSGFGGLQLTQGINVLYTDNGTSWSATPLLEVAQELGVSTEKVMSQKAVNTELGKKFDKKSVAQEPGDSEELVMSQKAVSDKLSDLPTKIATKFYFSSNTTGECSAEFDDETGTVVFSPKVSMRRLNGEKSDKVDIHEKLVAAGCTYDEKTGLCTISFGKNVDNHNITIYYLNGTYGVTPKNSYSAPQGAEIVLHIAKNPDTFYFYGGAAAIWTECYNNAKRRANVLDLSSKSATKFYFSLNTTGECSAEFDDETGTVVFSPIVSMRRFYGDRDERTDIHEKLVAAGCTYNEKTQRCTLILGGNVDNRNLTIYYLNGTYGVTPKNSYSAPQGAEIVLHIAKNPDTFYFYGGAAAIWTECYNNSKIKQVAANVENTVYNKVITQFSYKYPGTWSLGQKKITLLHFSDIHGDETNFKGIVQYIKKYKSMLTDVICTGDIVNYQFSDGIDWWKNNIENNRILMCIGNHDPLVTQGTFDWFGKNAAECYERYFSPYIANWGVNYTQDLCYYYKDYSDVSIRLIVLDGMRWNNIKEDTVQEEWFKQQLNDAKEKNLHVIVASHFPPDTSAGNKNNNINFDCWYATQAWENEQYGLLNPKVADSIDSFQKNGGNFICYIGGHTHGDLFRPLKRYPNQLMVIVANASCSEHVKNAVCWYSRSESDNSQELFNLLNIDTENKILSIVRVGCSFDRYARHIGTISFDYENHKVLSQY